jgi:hypothetical protein
VNQGALAGTSILTSLLDDDQGEENLAGTGNAVEREGPRGIPGSRTESLGAPRKSTGASGLMA